MDLHFRKNNNLSLLALFAIQLLLVYTSFFFFPRWEKEYTENTFGWDVLGYYLYLPAIFIYNDIETLEFAPKIVEKHVFTPDFQQATKVQNGNYILKYSCGQSFAYLPFFTIAHIFAKNSSYPADGFSKPYQFMINLGAIVIAILSLILLRAILLLWFPDKTVALTLLSIVFGSNYLEYSAINGNLTHNYLFMLYCLLIWYTVKFHENPKFKLAIIIGGIIGLAALTRPTEIIAIIIPLFWGLTSISISSIKERIFFLKIHISKIALGASICGLIGSVQLIYWKMVGDSWIIYSYNNEGFSWLNPHLYDCFLSYKTGWLVYSPIMAFSVLGFYFLYKENKSIFYACSFFFIVFTYLVTAWDNWWYGGGLGLRAMVQSYPVLSITMAASYNYFLNKKLTSLLLYLLLPFLFYHNLWLTYNAHEGYQYHAAQMTQAYYWRTIGKVYHNPLDLKLLDTDEDFTKKRKNVFNIYTNNFNDTNFSNDCTPPENNNRICIKNKESRSFTIMLNDNQKSFKWIRTSAKFQSLGKVWTYWKMPQFVIKFLEGDKVLKTKMIRINRHLDNNEVKMIFFDTKIPNKYFNKIQIQIVNEYGGFPLLVDDLIVESFE